MKGNTASLQGTLPQQQQKKSLLQGQGGNSENQITQSFTQIERIKQDMNQMTDTKQSNGEQQSIQQVKHQKTQQGQKNNQQAKKISTINSDDFEEDEPVQINLYSQSFSNDRFGGDHSRDYHNQTTEDNKINMTSSSRSVAEKNNSLQKNGVNQQNSSLQNELKQSQKNIIKPQSPKEGLRNSKVFQNNQQQNGKNQNMMTDNFTANYKQEQFNQSSQFQGITSNNPSALIDQYKLKYLQEVERSLVHSSQNQKVPQNNQGGEDILSQKMQLIEQKKKKIFQTTNNDIKSLKIPLINQNFDLMSKHLTHKKIAKTQIGYKKRLSLREQTKRRNVNNHKSTRLNKSMRAARLSTSFDLYCIYESKSEDSNDCSPQESRNRSFFFKSEKMIHSQFVPSSSSSSPKADQIYDSAKLSKCESDQITNSDNTNPNIDQQKPIIPQQKSSFIKKQSSETNSIDEQEKNSTLGNSLSNQMSQNTKNALRGSFDQKNIMQTKNIEEQNNLQNTNKNDISKQKKQSISKQQQQQIQNSDQINGKSQKNTSNHKKNTDSSSTKSHTSSQVLTPVSNQQQQSIKQANVNTQIEKKENMKNSQLYKPDHVNSKASDQTKDKLLSPLMTSSSLQKKEQQQQIIVYDLKNSKNAQNEKQLNLAKAKQQEEEQEQFQNCFPEQNNQSQEIDKQLKNSTRSNSSSDGEENTDSSPQKLNIINLYRNSSNQQEVSPNQFVSDQDELNPKETIKQNNNIIQKKRNSSLSNISQTGQNTSTLNNSKSDQSPNTALIKLCSNLTNGIDRIKEIQNNRFMTEEEGTPSQNSSNQIENFTQKIFGNTNGTKSAQEQYNSKYELINEMYQVKNNSDRNQTLPFEKKSQISKGDGQQQQQQILKGRRNSLNQIQGEKISQMQTLNQFKPFGQQNPYGVNDQNTKLHPNQLGTQSVSLSNNLQIKKSDSSKQLTNNTYRDQFKQKLDQKSIKITTSQNTTSYIQSNSKQQEKQSSKSPNKSKKQSENIESTNQQLVSLLDQKSDNTRSNMSSSQLNKNKGSSDMNQQIKANKQKVIKLQQQILQSHSSNTLKIQKTSSENNYTQQDTIYDLKEKTNTADQFFKKQSKPSSFLNSNVLAVDSQGRQISQTSQLDTQVSQILSSKTITDYENSNINEHGKQKRNVQVSEFQKDTTSLLLLGTLNYNIQSQSQSQNQSVKRDKNKNIKEELERISSNQNNFKIQQSQSQNNFIMNPQLGQIDLKKQVCLTSGKKEIIVQPIIQEDQQKNQQKKNKFNVESKVKNYIQAGQHNQVHLKTKEQQQNFHLNKGAGISHSTQNDGVHLNSKSLHQDSMNSQRYDLQYRKSSSILNTDDVLQNGNSTLTNQDSSVNNSDSIDKTQSYQYSCNSMNKHKSKDELKQQMNNHSQQFQPFKVPYPNLSGEGENGSKLSPVEFLTIIQQQMQQQRQMVAEQFEKRQQNTNQTNKTADISQHINSKGQQISNK